MGRNIPAGFNDAVSPDTDAFLSIAFMCFTITTTLAAVSALCGSRFRKKPKPNTTADVAEGEPGNTPSPPLATTPPHPQDHPDTAVRMSVDSALPPPPARRQLDINGSHSMKPKSNMTKLAQLDSRKLSSMSMKVGRSLSMSMRWSRKEAPPSSAASTAAGGSSSAQSKMKAKLEKEDSIWTKTIILGEKCRVEDEDDPVIFDNRGIKVTAYHPKVPSSLPVSRTTSYIDPDSIPSRTNHVIDPTDDAWNGTN